MQEDTVLKSYGMDKREFWLKADRLVKREGYERTLAYLKLLIFDKVFRERPLRKIDLIKLARKIKYFPGVHHYFDQIQKFMRQIPEVKEWGIQLEHYIVSSGLQSILEGTTIYSQFKKVYACEYEYVKGAPVFPKLVINDTNKTQFLFRINKGKLLLSEDINTHMPDEERRIPFRNMLYIGDGLSDIPSMTVMQKAGGSAIAVFDPAMHVPAAVKDMVREGRVDHFASADYRKDSLLVKIIHRTLKQIIYRIAYKASAGLSSRWVKKRR